MVWCYNKEMADNLTAICSKLNFRDAAMTTAITEKATEIIKSAEKSGLVMGSRIGTVSAAIYIAAKLCGDSRTQGEIKAAGGSNVTMLRKRYKEFANKLDIQIIL